jgi:hypothetical protein
MHRPPEDKPVRPFQSATQTCNSQNLTLCVNSEVNTMNNTVQNSPHLLITDQLPKRTSLL